MSEHELRASVHNQRGFPSFDDAGKPFLVRIDSDYVAYQLPISVKAVVQWGDLIPLLMNERDEWELPGGRLELGESPTECLSREVCEEVGWNVTFTNPFHAWVYEIEPNEHVLVLTYFGSYAGSQSPKLSNEHKSMMLASPRDLGALHMPLPYKEAIELAFSADGDDPRSPE